MSLIVADEIVADEPAARRRAVTYPSSDEKPMAETDLHRDLIFYFVEALKAFFALSARRVYVAGNNFLFWEENNPKARVSPDCYVVFGVEQRPRNSFKAWEEEEDKLPAVVFEFTSRKTRREDTDNKRALYERTLRVTEYFLFDPTGDYLSPRLQGHRLGADGHYGRLESEQLGLDLVWQAGSDTVRLFDPVRQRFLPTLVEAEARAETVETENARLRAELEVLRRRLAGANDTDATGEE